MMSSRILRAAAMASMACLAAACTTVEDAGGSVASVTGTARPEIKPIDATGFATTDALFAKPFIDVQEWRSAPVPHFYVHGGFEGTATRFSYYFPLAKDYQGRFFQHVTPVPDSENLAQKMPEGKFNKIGFAAASGAYFVETNGGGSFDITKGSQALADPTITAFRANAAAAQFSRHVAAQVYPGSKRPYGYVYGGSGGAFRTIGSLESTEGVWDGGVPYVNGSTMAIPNMFTVRMQALRVLRDKFPQIVDALEPGGSGDPYAGLTPHESEVLREAEKMGFPMESWFGWRTMGLHGFAALYGGVSMADPSYFTDFWTKPGYLGHDRRDLFKEDRLQHTSTIADIVTVGEAAAMGIDSNPFSETSRGGVDNAFMLPAGADPDQIVGLRLAEAPRQTYFLGGELMVQSGALAGQRVFLDKIRGDMILFGVTEPKQIAKLAVGDTVMVDNSNFLAMESYHRHQVPGSDFPVWDQFRDKAGQPIYPQRPFLVGPLFVRSTAGTTLTGNVGSEKVVLAASLWDREAMPWQADWYRRRVVANAGGTDNVRLYFTEHALHGDEPDNEDPSRIVSYQGPLQQSLRLLADWVEHGKVPPASTGYTIADGQVLVPGGAVQRNGIQPVVSLTANGSSRAEVRVGQQVRFEGNVVSAPAIGALVWADWDYDGDGTFVDRVPLSKKSAAMVRGTHRFATPGTYFVTLRAMSQPQDALGTPYAELINLARVRVVVSR